MTVKEILDNVLNEAGEIEKNKKIILMRAAEKVCKTQGCENYAGKNLTNKDMPMLAEKVKFTPNEYKMLMQYYAKEGVSEMPKGLSCKKMLQHGKMMDIAKPSNN